LPEPIVLYIPKPSRSWSSSHLSPFNMS